MKNVHIFWQGVFNSIFILDKLPTPKTSHQTLARFDENLNQSTVHDWQAVGSDIRQASIRTAKQQSPSQQDILLDKLAYYEPKTS